MASTSTNKQPLLVDRVLHEVIDLSGATVAEQAGIDITGTNSAAPVVDCTTNDGAIIEDVYSIARTTLAGYKINLYLSSASDYLRQQQGVYIGSLTGSTTAGTKTRIADGDLPYVLAPVPGAVSPSGENRFAALYIPRGKALWAAVEQQSAVDQALEAPLLGVQGGYY
jgi:hypothetical protein